MHGPPPTAIDVVTQQLRALGVRPGGVLLVHTSFRSIGPVEGGPPGLIQALRAALGDAGTLVMPTMSDGEALFDPKTTPSSGMGVVAETFWRQPGVLRTGHPGGSFAAAGPAAEFICAPQPLEPPHGVDSPPGRVWLLGGDALLLGVGHSESTTLHVAEAIAGVPYFAVHPCVIDDGHGPETVMVKETDHCCRGFDLVDEPLRRRGLLREGPVGRGLGLLCPSRGVVAVAVELLQRDPLAFLCSDDVGCGECDDARASVVVG
jgi:aminoglycoside 3-N-acetyltransferase